MKMNAAEVLGICGADLTVGEDDLIAGVVVLVKVVEPDGAVRLASTWSDGLSWLERRGMLETATDVERCSGEDT